MPFYDRWLDGAIGRLGYIKAREMATAPVFAGESSLAGEFGSTNITDEQREQSAITSAWVYSDIRTIANAGSAADVDIWHGQDEIEDHPAELLLERPNPHMAASWMRQYTLQWLLLHGEAYWLKVFDRSGAIAELWPIPSSHIQPLSDPTEYIRGYKYTPANGRPAVLFEPRQIVFFRLPNPFNYHRGLSPLSAYRLAVETDLAASQWNKRTFEDDVTLRMLISVPAEMSTPNFNRTKAELTTELVERQKRYMIARAGAVTVNSLSISPKDMEFLAGRTFTREEIDRVFGIPAGFWAKEATRANSDAAKAVMVEQAIWPLLVLLAETITQQLVRPEFGDELELRFEDIRSEDREMLIKERQTYWQVQTVNEARHELGLEPLPDSDVGETLVPTATRGAANTGWGSDDPTGDGMTKAAHDDLRRWESIARRRGKAGESATYDFESAHIPAVVKAGVLDKLTLAGTDEEVRAAFAAPFWWY